MEQFIQVLAYLTSGVVVAIYHWWFWGVHLELSVRRPIWLVLAVLVWPGFLALDSVLTLGALITRVFAALSGSEGQTVPTPLEAQEWWERRKGRKRKTESDLLPAGRPAGERSER